MTIPEDTLSIETPENVAFGYAIAGIGSRFLAALADTLLITVLETLLYFLILYPLVYFDVAGSDPLGNWWVAILGLLLFAVYWGYYIFFEIVWNGQTPGKRWQGLRVVRADGMPVGLGESAIRNLVRIVDFLPAYYGLGVVVMFFNAQSRRLGDLAAGTLVVRDRGALKLENLAVAPPPRLAAQPKPQTGAQPGGGAVEVGGLPIERLRRADLALVDEYFNRRAGLPNRASLARQIARALYQRMSLPWSAQDEQQAEEILAAVQSAAREKEG